MKEDTLAKLRQFEDVVKSKNTEAKKILTSAAPVVEEVKEAGEAIGKAVAEVVPIVQGWRALFCCGK